MTTKNKEALICFVLGFGLFLFTRMSRLVPTIPVMILIAPVFILRFIRTQPSVRGNLLTFAGFVLSMNISLLGLFDLGGGFASLLFNLIRSTLLALLYYLPYLFDRWLYPRFRRFKGLSTLIFPITTTGLMYLLTLEGPFEGAYQMGKFLYGPAAFKQIISVAGLPAAVFLSSWFASIVNYVREGKLEWRRIKGVTLTYAALVSAALIFGLIKSAPARWEEQETVRTASIVLAPEAGSAVELTALLETRTPHDIDSRLELFEAKTRFAAANGARIVMSHELAFLIHETDREYFTERCSRLAEKYGIYLAMNYGYYAAEGKGRNTLILIDDKGRVIMEYAKKYLLGIGDMGETVAFEKGPETLQYADTPYGRISVCICREIDIAKYMVQAGRNGVDIMLSPAYEWPENLTINYGYMRGIENGFSVVRSSYNGITTASDFNGRLLAVMPFTTEESNVMFADVPIKGVRTVYPYIGPLLAWICLAGLAALIVGSFILKKRENRNEQTEDSGLPMGAASSTATIF